MKAMLLTAGIGQRMLPLTLRLPKPAIPVLGRPLVFQALHWLQLKGVDEVVLNLHHLPDRIEAVLRNGGARGLPSIRYTREDVILGTAGGLRNAAPLLRGGEPIVVCNSDSLSDIDLEAAVDAHVASGCLATLVVTSPRTGYSVVRTDDRGRVVSLAGLPEVDDSRVAGDHLFTGYHIIEEEVLDRIPPTGASDIVRDVYRPLAEEGKLGSFRHDGFWWEFGSPRLYLEGSLLLMGLPLERLARICAEYDTVRGVGDALVALGAGAEVDPGARLIGRVALGFSTLVGERASIEDSVIMPEAWIGPGCRLERSVIALGVELPAGFESVEELVCVDPDPERALPPSTRREDGLLRHSFASKPRPA